MMLRALILALVALITLPLAAAEAPVLEVEFPETETIPGRPLTLRLTILTPSWLVKPASFPGLETPDLLVRLPERATTPISRAIEGASWSGVSRRYLLTPMIAGRFAIPAQDITVIYADPDGGAPLTTTLRTKPLTFAGVAPEGAEGLDPFIAAEALALAQTLSGPTEGLKPGDTVTRTVTARITGASAMFLPTLLTPRAVEGLAAYPGAPDVSDQEARGEITGTRIETMTYAAQSGGSGAAPGVELRWYNLSSGTIETAFLPKVALSVDAPVAAADRDLRSVAAGLAAALAGLLAAWPIARRAAARLRAWIDARRAARLASAAHAWDLLMATTARRDHGAMRGALNLWAARREGADPRDDAALRSALIALGAARYGVVSGDDAVAWAALTAALRPLRHAAPAAVGRTALPPLNPIFQRQRTN